MLTVGSAGAQPATMIKINTEHLKSFVIVSFQV
jgi:hypothetical protein